MKVLGRDKLVTYTLDADTGKVLETDNDRLEKLFTRLEPDDIRGAPTTLAQAIGIAEQRSGGKAIEAEVDRDSDAVSYERHRSQVRRQRAGPAGRWRQRSGGGGPVTHRDGTGAIGAPNLAPTTGRRDRFGPRTPHRRPVLDPTP